ncbi:BC1872 family protein [Paenibacillus harenae]|uniref:BC1872 family protein n=1 Tax=Paenibacillus harenae TaxID=306543 RepID=UPI00048F5EA8|nr:hypothetical protein [Paenibacillus harenae]
MTEKITREQILAMEPGRELDALVAEKVMGWTNKILPVTPFDSHSAPYWCVYGVKVNPVLNWSPSSNISASWEVVEHLRGVHGLKILISPQNHEGFYLHVRNEMGGNITGVYEFDFAPVGIAKIALLAVMDE